MPADIKNINKQIDLKITNQLYLHSPFAIFAAIFSTIFIVILFHNRAHPLILYSWATAALSFLAFRFFFCRYIIQQQITINNYKLRLKQFTITICLSGIILGSAGILFISPDSPAYNSFIFFLMGGMFAGTAGTYAIKQSVFYAFSAPVFLPVMIYTFMLDNTIHTVMSLMGVIFIIMMIGVVRRMNVTIIEAYTLSIENKILAERAKLLNAKLKLSNDNLKTLSFKDTMTNVSNRRFLTEIMEPETARFAYSLQHAIDSHENKDVNLKYGVYIIDIDHFKSVNDTWGHKCGDDVIIQFANVIKTLIRKEDLLCRWGGEEFVVIIKRTVPEYIEQFANKLMQSIRNTQFQMSDSVTINKTCSVGYAKFPFFDKLPLALTLDQTIEIADRALYYAKEHGRDKAVLAKYNPAQDTILKLEETKTMMQDITDAVKRNDIILTELKS